MHQVKLRIHPKLWQRLTDMAKQTGKSMNQTTVEMIEQGFNADGRQADIFGSPEMFRFARALSAVATAAANGDDWLSDASAYDRVIVAIEKTLNTLRPQPPSVRSAFAAVLDRKN